MLIYILKTKNIQSYKLEKIDILYVVLLGIIVLIIAYINFGFPFEIKYETGDPSVHYLLSQKFAEGDVLLAANPADQVYRKFCNKKDYIICKFWNNYEMLE